MPSTDGGSGDNDGGPSSASADDTAGPGTGNGCGVGDVEPIGGGTPGPTGFPPGCNPNRDPGTNGYRCCSDDPAAPGGELPAYAGLGIAGAPPFFADASNDSSTSGVCVRVADFQGVGNNLASAGVEGCPIPCNPTWEPDALTQVCGPTRQCCQTQELQPADCVMDEATGLWRPVHGQDIGIQTDWTPGSHATHQDPNGVQCLAIATAAGDPSGDVFQDCVRQLSVANQRGYCMSLGPGQSCPLTLPTYVDACEALN